MAAHGGRSCGTIRQAADTWMAKAEGKAVIDYGFHMILREFNDALSEEMAVAVKDGITSFKLFTAYPGVFLMDDGMIFRTMQRAGEVRGLLRGDGLPRCCIGLE